MRHVTRAFLFHHRSQPIGNPGDEPEPARCQRVVPGVGVVTQQIPSRRRRLSRIGGFSPSIAQFIVILIRGIGLRLIIPAFCPFKRLYGPGTAPLAQESIPNLRKDSDGDLDRNDAIE
jgi:hypothetical protein